MRQFLALDVRILFGGVKRRRSTGKGKGAALNENKGATQGRVAQLPCQRRQASLTNSFRICGIWVGCEVEWVADSRVHRRGAAALRRRRRWRPRRKVVCLFALQAARRRRRSAPQPVAGYVRICPDMGVAWAGLLWLWRSFWVTSFHVTGFLSRIAQENFWRPNY